MVWGEQMQSLSFASPSYLLRPLFGLASGAPEGVAKETRTGTEEHPNKVYLIV